MLRIHTAGTHPRRSGRIALGKARLIAAAVITFALTSGVGAASLAQPNDDALERRAADYVRYREDIAAIEAKPFTSAEVTREAHRRLAAHNSKRLSSGWAAYAALVAADTPAFRDALQDELDGASYDGMKGREAVFAQMAKDPGYARRLGGANAAIDRVIAMTAADASRFAALGETFKSQAYAMQKTKWGMGKLPAPSARLDDADSYARGRGGASAPSLPASTDKGVTQPMLASAPGAWAPDWGKSTSGRMTGENAEIIMTRILNLAARYAAGDMNEQLVDTYARNDRSDNCLSMASLTLRQCIAATRAPYEEAFCLGEHGLNDVAGCVGWVAGAGD